MPSTTYDIDNGKEFGRWSDTISKFMYFESMKPILNLINIPKRVADYGGANGLLKNFIPDSISIDIDNSKNPDICEDIFTHKGEYDLIIIRYVLHYLNDYEVIRLLKHIKSFHSGPILIIQFVNNQLIPKYQNSVNEVKFFRTEQQLDSLLGEFRTIYSSAHYRVGKEFYKNRLGINNAIPHLEKIKAYYNV